MRRLKPGEKRETLVWKPREVARLLKAQDADVFAFTEEDYDDSPDLFVDRRRPRLAAAGVADQPVPEGLPLGPLGAGQLHECRRQGTPGRPDLPGRLPAGQDVPDDRVHLRTTVGPVALLHRSLRAAPVQRLGLLGRGVLRVHAGYRLPGAEPGALGGGLRRARGEDGAGRWQGGSEEGRDRRPLVGRLPDGLPRDPDRRLRRGSRRHHP